MTEEEMWNDEEPVSRLGIDVPAWIDQDISPCDIAAICQGGCASGAYMPAVAYYQAQHTMSEYGDSVLQFIEDNLGELPRPEDSISWSGLAVHYLSCAVELWASNALSELEQTELEEVKT